MIDAEITNMLMVCNPADRSSGQFFSAQYAGKAEEDSEALVWSVSTENGNYQYRLVDGVNAPAATSLALQNDLLKLMKEGSGGGLRVEAVDDNIYEWRVSMHGFSGAVGDALRALKGKFGKGEFELRLQFKMDVFPFFPPTCDVIWPRYTTSCSPLQR